MVVIFGVKKGRVSIIDEICKRNVRNFKKNCRFFQAAPLRYLSEKSKGTDNAVH